MSPRTRTSCEHLRALLEQGASRQRRAEQILIAASIATAVLYVVSALWFTAKAGHP